MNTILTIAGSDCSGGAGIQADIKTISAHKMYAMSVITALTAQNTQGVQGIYPVPASFIEMQIDSIFNDIPPEAIKIGMLFEKDIILSVAKKLKEYDAKNIVLDPVMISTSGHQLFQNEASETLMKELMPLAKVITPNLPEAEALWGRSIRTEEDMAAASKEIGERIGCAVLVKGGHMMPKQRNEAEKQWNEAQKQQHKTQTQRNDVAKQQDEATKRQDEMARQQHEATDRRDETVNLWHEAQKHQGEVAKQQHEIQKHQDEVAKQQHEAQAQQNEVTKQQHEAQEHQDETVGLRHEAADCLYETGKLHWFRHPWVYNNNTHGTGCTLSSAIACNLAAGCSLPEAVAASKAYLTGALKADPKLGKGHGPLNHMYR